ncbi:hypothetical protein LEMLEM_LOCUS21674, partial [Lemmus lemmus]
MTHHCIERRYFCLELHMGSCKLIWHCRKGACIIQKQGSDICSDSAISIVAHQYTEDCFHLH